MGVSSGQNESVCSYQLSSSQAPGPPRLQRMVINIRHAVLLKLTQPLRRRPNIFTQLNYFYMGSRKYF